MSERRDRWNHNIHYYDIVLDAATSTARTALDVGTGDGLLAVRLAEKVPEVTGIDSDADVIACARSSTSANVTWVTGDVLTCELPAAHYDLVAAVATVHHLPDLSAGFERLACLTAAGGTLVVIGCARSSSVHDYALDIVGAVQHQVFSRIRGYWQHTAPVQMHFPHTYAEVEQIATAVLPGMRWRRLPLWRYAVTWRKPGGPGMSWAQTGSAAPE
ncbi:class I SAM-dependent methyltransferase [Mycolicibacterium arenosum]|uniref:Class I SAM-dependent methyltransferase n=1 Tax=Mycolicibacterium arenosum TaxID=2952157 RepID=A0ABT1M730_9MYCO|nr:class I SAM-dependent methyltransferase [Mycolicibacterium sp. CAU 1645]MCP9274984.1 class I SAM-dependent methyltransferase [Mycolicibacterium sp. CAU 1645]